MLEHSPADDQAFFEPESLRDFRAYAPGNHHRLDLGQVSFEVVRVGTKNLFADDHSQDSVTEKLHAFVGVAATGGNTGVG